MAGQYGGKRVGARRAARPRGTFDPRVAGLAAGITLSVIAWGLLVWAAIDFGAAARSGQGAGWAMLALCSVGAVACLFIGLMLVAALARALGITSPPPDEAADVEPAARPAGGRRAAR